VLAIALDSSRENRTLFPSETTSMAVIHLNGGGAIGRITAKGNSNSNSGSSQHHNSYGRKEMIWHRDGAVQIK